MNFNQKVYQVVSQIPKGKVATYGQIAVLVGNPRAARQVGWVLHQLPVITNIPWQRIINRHGMISTTCQEHTYKIQKELLVRESVEVKKINSTYFINMKKYLWRP